MKVEIEAEWGPSEHGWADEKFSQLKISGMVAEVLFKGDVWEWSVAINDGWVSAGSGWVDSEEEAKAAAEALIRSLLTK